MKSRLVITNLPLPPPPESEKGLSTEGKVFVGLGAAAAAVIGGILVKDVSRLKLQKN